MILANPKVYEFAKEIGMSPLALMDKIKEWKIPVKSHMAELEPVVLEQIRIKLKGGVDTPVSAEKKPPRTVKKTASSSAGVDKATNITRPTTTRSAQKTKEVVQDSTATSGQTVAGPRTKAAGTVVRRKAVSPTVEVKPEVIRESPSSTTRSEVVAISSPEKSGLVEEADIELDAAPSVHHVEPVVGVPVAKAVPPKTTKKEAEPLVPLHVEPENVDEVEAAPVDVVVKIEVIEEVKVAPELPPMKVAPAVSVSVPSASPRVSGPPVIEAAVVVNTVPEAPVPPPVTNKVSPPVNRKKEVVVGASGVSSSPGATAAPRRNIVGRMDLSRVQPPPRPGFTPGGPRSPGGPQTGGFRGGNQDRSGGPGGFRPGGVNNNFARPKGNIRPGFVAAPPPMPIEEDRKRDDRKRPRSGAAPGDGGAAAASAKTNEEEGVSRFDAAEFRKREMVFQPKKKRALLHRPALQTQITTPKASKRVVKIHKTMTVGDLASEMNLKVPELMKALIKNGVMAQINTELDFDTIALIVPEFGFEAQSTFKTAQEILVDTTFGEVDAEKVIRSPVVTVMGHVDHGKTSLLDAIRKADVAAGEAGGITQHIGAYQVAMEDGSKITFLDTPGHEAFTAMRARGANVTDIAVIVVAADDGVMPQTAEAISHAKAAGVPIIVAINKMDKAGANPDRIKQQLTEHQLVPEEWGGDTIFVPVSAIKREGIKELLEQIQLVAEVQELKANPKRSGTGIVIEARIEKGRGPVATLIVKDGTISVGQTIVAGSVKGRVRSLLSYQGERLQEVTPGMPAEILGLESLPQAGDPFDVVENDDVADQVIQARLSNLEKVKSKSKLSLDEIFAKVTQGDVKELVVVLKADVAGSLEAIQGMMQKLGSSEVKLKILHAAIGGISESDVLLASTAKGIIVGFNVRPDNGGQAAAKRLGVDVRTYSIVYELMDDLTKALSGLLTPEIREVIHGRAEVRNLFVVPKIGTIAGCLITDGKVGRAHMVRLIREGRVVYEGKLGSLKRFKDDAKEVAQGFECGIGIENYNDLKVGDIIEAYSKEQLARSL